MFPFYLFINFFFFSFYSNFFYWILIELNTLTFILLINSVEKSDFSINLIFYYFLIQSLGSFMFILGFILQIVSILPSDFCIYAVTMKMGIFPFHFWVFKLCNFICNFTFFILMTLQKLYLYLYFFHFNNLVVDFLLLSNLTFGAIFLYFSNSLKEILVSSSIIMFFWFMNFFYINSLMFYVMFLSYTFMTFFLMYILNFKYDSVAFSIFIVFIMGIPPLSLFFFKYYTVSMFFIYFSLKSKIFICFITFFTFLGYFKYFYNFFLNNYFFYKDIKINNFFWFYIYMHFLSFFC